MPRKRNALEERDINSASKTNDNGTTIRNITVHERNIYQIFECSEKNESFHKKYITEMRSLYSKVSFQFLSR